MTKMASYFKETLGELRETALKSLEKNKANNSTDDGSESTNLFVSSLVINFSISLLALGLFSFLRPRLKQIYSPRQLLLDVMFPLGKLPHSFFAWVIPAFMANDDDVFYYAGIDALVYMRFMRLCVKISLVIMPYGIAVLLPLNYFGGEGLHGLDRVALSNIEHESSKVWAHVVPAWFYTFIICYLLYEEWKMYIMYRQEYLSSGKGYQYAVLIRDLPVKFQNEQSMKSYLEELFPDQIEDVIMIEDLRKWQALIEKHDNLVWKLERSKAVYELTGERPTHHSHPCGTEFDSIARHEGDLTTLQSKLESEMNQEHNIHPCAFIIFRSLRMATTAVQIGWDNYSLNMNVTPAPGVTDVIWGNLGVGLWRRKFCTGLVYAAIFALVFFWAVPVGFISALITLKNIAKVAPWLDAVLSYNNFARGIIEGVLSSLTLWIFFAILPLIYLDITRYFYGVMWLWFTILERLTRLEGLASQSEVDKSVLGKLFIFVIVNQFLFLSAGAAVFGKFKEILRKPEDIPQYLAQSLPAQATFFICYIVFRGLTGTSLELLRIFYLIIIPIKRKWFCHTPREDEAAWRPPYAMYDRLYKDHLFVLIVGISYSVLAPLITPFLVLYFGFGYIAWMHQILCVYIPVYSTGGRMWPIVFNRIIAGMIVFHLLMTGVLSLKESFIAAGFMLPLPVITILFFLFIQQHCLKPSMYLSINMASGLAEASPRFLQSVAQSYVRNYRLPPTYGLSSSPINGGDYAYDDEERSPVITPSHSTGGISMSEEFA